MMRGAGPPIDRASWDIVVKTDYEDQKTSLRFLDTIAEDVYWTEGWIALRQ
jgi:hypothetical protein